MDQNTRRFDQEPDQPTSHLYEEEGAGPPAGQVCVKCGGSLILAKVGMDNQNGLLAVKRSDVWIGVISGGISRVQAQVCMECGFTEFYTIEPVALLDK